MAKPLLNEAEQFLISRWREVAQMRDTIQSVQDKYEQFYEQALQIVQERNPSLDFPGLYVRRGGDGSVGIGRRKWPSNHGGWPSGFAMWDMRLESLTDDRVAEPIAYVQLVPKASEARGIDLLAARAKCMGAARELLGLEYGRVVSTPTWGTKHVMLALSMPPKRTLVEMLLAGDCFTDFLVQEFSLLARFTSALDEITSA